MLGVERGVPIPVPVEQFGVVPETFREIFLVEHGDEIGVVQIGLANELCGRAVIALFFPVDGNLRLTDFVFAFMVFRDFFCS